MNRHYQRFLIVGLGALCFGIFSWRITSAQALIQPIQPVAFKPDRDVQQLAFGIGERLHFRFGWNGIPAAEMIMEVQGTQTDGRRQLRLSGKARTLPHVEWIYSLRDEVESVIDESTFAPMSYALLQNEKGVLTETFVHADGLSLRGTRKSKKNEPELIITRDGDFDPVTVAYLARSVSLNIGSMYQYRVFDGRAQYLLSFRVVKRERIKVKAGTYSALRIVPSVLNLTKPSKQRKVKHATIWVSDDAYRVPLKMESQVLFGKVYGELVGYQRGKLINR